MVPNRRILLVAVTAALAVAATLAAHLLPRHAPGRPGPSLDLRRAQELTEVYRRDTVARMAAGLRYGEAVRSYYVACPDAPGRYTLSSRFDLRPDSGTAFASSSLRDYWQHRGYRVLNDTPGTNGQL